MNGPGPGWYGKLSCLGDFASRRLQPEWVRGCDDWLARCMTHGRETLGAAWLPAYLAAPPWRFIWAPDTLDAHWWVGLLMPSCDNVGRYFPLVVAQPRALLPDDDQAWLQLARWWDDVALAALDTLEVDATLERFERRLQALSGADGSAAPGADMATSASGAWRRTRPTGEEINQLADSLASPAQRDSLRGHSLWWPWSDVPVASALTVSHGLPTPELFTRMIGGR